jgi:hypothetical protein
MFEQKYQISSQIHQNYPFCRLQRSRSPSECPSEKSAPVGEFNGEFNGELIGEFIGELAWVGELPWRVRPEVPLPRAYLSWERKPKKHGELTENSRKIHGENYGELSRVGESAENYRRIIGELSEN